MHDLIVGFIISACDRATTRYLAKQIRLDNRYRVDDDPWLIALCCQLDDGVDSL